MVSIEQWYSRRSTSLETHMVKRALHNLFTDCTTDTVIQLGDGINEVSAECQLIVQHVTDSMMFNSATLRLQRMTAITFLSHVFTDFVEGLAAIIPCPKENLFIFSIQEDNSSEDRILNVSFSAKPSDSRHPETFFSSQYLQERVYLGRAILARLTHVHVLPFEDNLCVREPCINFEQCLSVLKFGNASDFISSDMYFFRSIIPINTFACRCPPGFTVMSRRKQRSAFDQVSDFDRGRTVAYRDCGLPFREIGRRVGRNQTTVMRISDRWMQEDRQILRIAVTDLSVPSRTVAQHIESVTHHSVSARTIRRRLQ
ncbi:protocadherin-like wing polarity protein stan [Trichonephila clavipes]|nr:protocadherin-like wing polarity protein stan [Trichonephila clavipes]